MSMFSFQAIHNSLSVVLSVSSLFIDYVNVLFSSNSQLVLHSSMPLLVVYRLCQCSLFKQFTTIALCVVTVGKLFIDYVNVLFSSNSQHMMAAYASPCCCLSIMSMFSFQAIHNGLTARSQCCRVVYRLCQCSLFKQFTTIIGNTIISTVLFIDYVNVLFSSNSQPERETEESR